MFNYNQIVLDHFHHPQNVGVLDQSDPHVGTGISGTAAEGQLIHLQIYVDFSTLDKKKPTIVTLEQGIIEKAVFKTHGCVSCIATPSWLTTYITSKTIKSAQRMTSNMIQNALQLPAQEAYCALMAEDALKAAIADVIAKQTEGISDKQQTCNLEA